jgi:hypothetical protein
MALMTPQAKDVQKQSTWAQLRALGLELLPAWLKKIVEKGLLRVLLLCVLALVVAPLLLAYLAALWLRVLGGVDSPVVAAARDAYVKVIQEGFAVEDVVTRSHALLDYVVFYSHDLKPLSNPLESLVLNLQRGQRATVHVGRAYPVSGSALGETCALPSNAGRIELLDVHLGGQPLGPMVAQGEKLKFEVNEIWWNENAQKIYTTDLAQTLTFRLSDAVMKWDCSYVHVEGAVHVYKNVYHLRPSPQ